MARGNRPTLALVAARAGVSIGTASSVFTGNASVSATARQAVLDAASELGYRPVHRRGPDAAQEVLDVCLVGWPFHSLTRTSPYYGPLLDSAQLTALELGVGLRLETAVPDGRNGWRLPLSVQRRQVQGVLVVGGESDPGYVDQLLGAGLAVVLVDHGERTARDRYGSHPVDVVRHDDEQAGYLATRLLLAAGHTRVPPAVVAGPPALLAAQDRLTGYRRALAEAGLAVHPGHVRHSSFDRESGRAAMDQLLDVPVRPTAVFCANDASALGAMDAVRARGLRVPEDVSVVGVDNELPAAEYSAPPLTSVALDTLTTGSLAVRLLVDRIKDPRRPPILTRVGVRLVERGSVTRPPA